MKYIVKLSEQEEMNLRQLALHPGFDPLLKLLQGESLAAQALAMECEDLDREKRLLALSDAQRTAKVVSNLTRKLVSYREILQVPAVGAEPDLAVLENLWDREGT
jgi:hypothetical protein